MCCLLFSCTNVDVPSLCSRHVVFRPSPDATACRSDIFSPFPGSIGTSHSLCLGNSICVCIHPSLTRQGSLDNCSDSYSTFIVVWFCRSSMRCQRCTTRTTSSVTLNLDVCRQHVESFWLPLWNSFKCNPWQWKSSSFFCEMQTSLSIPTQEPSFCQGVTHKPSQFAASHASFSGCLVQLMPRTKPFLLIRKTVPG